MGSVTSSTVLVLTNAIYFNASWSEPFEPTDTHDGTFTNLGGAAVPRAFMHQTKEHLYAEGEGFQALELAYAGDDVSMLVILPAAGTFASFRKTFDAAQLSTIGSALGTRSV